MVLSDRDRGGSDMDDQVPTICAALAAVMADVTHVGKEGQNTAQGYAFRGIDGVLNAVGPAFRRHGVIALPHVEQSEHQLVEVGKNRTPMRQATVVVRYVFHGPRGDSLDCVVAAEAMDSGDKATSKAMSVAHRTALIQALALPTHEPDPDERSYERAPAGQSDITAPPASTGNSDDFPISLGEAKVELLAACGGDTDRARDIWGERKFDGMNRAELDALIAKVDA